MRTSPKRRITLFLIITFFLLCKNLYGQCENESSLEDEIICLRIRVSNLNIRLEGSRIENQDALDLANDHVNELEERLENETFNPLETDLLTEELHRQIRQLGQLVASKDASINALQRSLATAQNNYLFCLEINEGLLTTISEKESEIHLLTRRLASQSNYSLNEEYLTLNRVLRRRVDSLERVINNISSSPLTNNNPPNDSLAAVLVELNNVRGEIRNMQLELRNAYENITQLNGRINGLNNRISLLNNRLTQAKNRIKELDSQLETALAEIEVLEATIENLVAEIQERDRKIGTLTIERDTARDSIRIHIVERDFAIKERNGARDTIGLLTHDIGSIISYVNQEEKRKRRYEYNSFLGIKLGFNALPRQTREIKQSFGASLLSSLQLTLLGKRLGLWFGNITNINEGMPPAEFYTQLELDQAYRMLVEGGFNPSGLGISTSHANIQSFQTGLYFRLYPQLYMMGGLNYLKGKTWQVYQTDLAPMLEPNALDGNYAISTSVEGMREVNPVVGVAWHQPLSKHKTRGSSLLVESGFNLGFSNFFTNVGVTFQLTNIEPDPLDKSKILERAKTSAAVSRRSLDSTINSINDLVWGTLIGDEQGEIEQKVIKTYSERKDRIESTKSNKSKRKLIRGTKKRIKKKIRTEREKSNRNLRRKIEKLLNDVEGLDDTQKRNKIRFWEAQIKVEMRKNLEEFQETLIQQLDELRP